MRRRAIVVANKVLPLIGSELSPEERFELLGRKLFATDCNKTRQLPKKPADPPPTAGRNQREEPAAPFG
jgi:hypothetical protein